MPIPLKPRKSDERKGLKQLKDGFDDPTLDSQEPLAEFSALRPVNAPMRAYQGEYFHQLGLRKERRGEIERAARLYERSFEALTGNPHGQARTLRDWGSMIATHIDGARGLAMVREALVLHDDDDLDNAKGRRQRLITESYLWRMQVVTGTGSREAKRKLIELACGPDFDFFVRDRKVIVDFLVPRTRGVVHREMLAKQVAIDVERRKPLRLIRSGISLVIDIELAIAASVLRKILRKE